MLCQMTESIQKISKILSTFWGAFRIFVWTSNKQFLAFQGNDLAKFVAHIPNIISFMTAEFVETEY